MRHAKICSTCKQCKPLSQYHRARANPDGHQYRCKPCAIAAVRRTREKHDALYGSYKARYDAENKERIQACNHFYWATHRVALSQRKRLRVV
jgi:hypothetical protein